MGLALDSLANALTGGDPDATVSLRLAQANRDGRRVGVVGCKILDVVMGEGHCEEQFDTEEARENDRGEE